MKLTTEHRTLIRSNPTKAILGAYEAGNDIVLDYALSVASEEEYRRARNRAVMLGLDIDVCEFDAGNY